MTINKAKKYYWLKLKDDFFRTRAIKKLRHVVNGDTFTIIYLKMQLLSIKNDGVISFEGTEATIEELMLCKGIGEAKAITLLAAIELGKRVLQPICRTHVISTPRDAYLYLKDQLEHLNQEHVVCLFLDIKS